jgi:hypothetical protein
VRVRNRFTDPFGILGTVQLPERRVERVANQFGANIVKTAPITAMAQPVLVVSLHSVWAFVGEPYDSQQKKIEHTI